MLNTTKTGVVCALSFTATVAAAFIAAESTSPQLHSEQPHIEAQNLTPLPESLPMLEYALPKLDSSTSLQVTMADLSDSDIDNILEPKPWNTESSQSLIRSPEYLQSIEYQTVELSPSMQTEIVVGDRVTLPLDHENSIDVTITADMFNDAGDYTWEGDVIDSSNGARYPVVVTQGAHGTYGSIATADGTYTLTTIEGQGVIYKNPQIAGPRGRDFLIPDFHG